MRHPRSLLLAILLSAGWGDCHDNTQICVPTTTKACYCATGEPGQVQCSASGEEYGECECLPDAGVDVEPEAQRL